MSLFCLVWCLLTILVINLRCVVILLYYTGCRFVDLLVCLLLYCCLDLLVSLGLGDGLWLLVVVVCLCDLCVISLMVVCLQFCYCLMFDLILLISCLFKLVFLLLCLWWSLNVVLR